MEKIKTKKGIIFFLSLAGFFGIFSTTISKNPVLPLFVKGLGADDSVLGLIAAISPLAGIVFSFPVGMLSDKIGRRRLLLVSAAVFVSAPLLYILVSNAYMLIPIRFFHGIATAILGPVASAIIAENYADNKGEKLGIYSSATLIGRTIAPLVGGSVISLLASAGGLLPYKAVYLIAFLSTIPVLFSVLWIKSDENTGKTGGITLKDFLSALVTFVKNSKLLSTSLVDFSIYFAFGAFETYLPVYLTAKGYPVYQIGFIFSLQILAIALTKPLFGKLSDITDRRTQILIGLIVVGISAWTITLNGGMVFAIILSLIFGLGMSLATVATSAYVADNAEKGHLGSAMGVLSSIMDVGQSSGPFITGMIVTKFSMQAGLFASFVVSLFVAILFVLLNLKRSDKT